MTDYEKLEPLTGIAEMSWFQHTPTQLSEWERKREANGFPEVKERVGRYKFFDPEEVKKWYILYTKATKNMGRGKDLNDAKR